MVGTFGEDRTNKNGEELRQIATYNNLKLTNTFFLKKDIHKYTWSARGQRSLIDYIIAKDKIKNSVQDVSVYIGSDLNTDHYLLVATITSLTR